MEWVGDDRMKDNGVSGLDHVVGQGRPGNYWNTKVAVILVILVNARE